MLPTLADMLHMILAGLHAQAKSLEMQQDDDY